MTAATSITAHEISNRDSEPKISAAAIANVAKNRAALTNARAKGLATIESWLLSEIIEVEPINPLTFRVPVEVLFRPSSAGLTKFDAK